MDKSTRDAILAEANAAKSIMDTAEREKREMSDVEKDTIGTHLGKAAAIEGDWKKREEFRKQFTDLTGGLGLEPDTDPDRPVGAPKPEPKNRKTVGQMFVSGNEYKSLLKNVPNGAFSEKMRVQSDPMSLPGGMKDLFYSGDHAASAGVLMENDHRGMLSPFFERPLSIRQLFTQGSTTSDTIDYIRWASVTNNAAVVKEARSEAVIDGTTVTAVIGGLKPQSTFTFSRDSTTVKTIAHWIPITKRALSDVGQMQTYIDSFLRYGLEEEFEDQLIAGSGSGENFLGLANISGIQTQAAPSGGQTNLDTLLMARTKVEIGGRATPTAYVMNPLDWQQIELMKDTTGNYYGAGPFSRQPKGLWGLPVTTSEAVAVGTAWCAAWNWGIVYDREQASVQATDTHADFFVRNLVAILAEMRAAFAVTRPQAFVKATLA